MQWRGRRQSSNVEDRRGSRPRISRKAGAGGGIGVIVIALVAAYFGIDPAIILNAGGGGGITNAPTTTSAPPRQTEAERALSQFVSVVLADTEDVWHAQFRAGNRQYVEPKLVLFSDAVNSACGLGKAAMGPFYCPGDQKVYIDLSFYRDLKNRHGAPGDFAQAYVVAHEVGHHVQTLLGISKQVHARRAEVSKAAGNRLSVMQELQADCFAGLWAHHAQRTKNILDPGDLEEALRAASSIGDDRLQSQARGRITPESFTHGTSEQRVRWFRKGFEEGNMASCNTFKARTL